MDTDKEENFTRTDEQSYLGSNSTANHTYTSLSSSSSVIGEGLHTAKRTSSEAFEGTSTSEGPGDVEDLQPAHKHRKPEANEEQIESDASGEEFYAKIVFALDYSSSVSDEEFIKEFNFVKDITESWKFPPENSSVALVVYADWAKTIPLNPDDNSFSVQLNEMEARTRVESKYRRMDLALTEAAGNFSGHSLQQQLVVLITAGRQFSGTEKDDDHDFLVSATEVLSSKNIKVVIVPVGLETDFRQLGLIVKRPQSLYPLDSFDDMTPDAAQNIASNIIKTIDIEAYAKETLDRFSDSRISQVSGLWEKISLCCDVIEGAWYSLYDDQKKRTKQKKIKMLIRENIDNFHSTLVTESKICISLAVFGPLGAGKSYFLNFLLNSDLPDVNKVKNGPLPSASGGSQTPVPVYVKYGKKVQVLLQKHDKNASPVVWFPEEELGDNTLARVNSLLNVMFQEKESLSAARCVELQGPFPIFRYLKKREMTSSGHLELDVDVEFVDVPGYGDETGNESINVELSKADVVLFFDSGKSGRPVSAEDIAQIFRRREELEFTARPKLVHVVNDREMPDVSSCDFHDLKKKKKEDLNKAWSSFLSSSSQDVAKSGCYRDVRKKLPQLNGEALLEKLSSESDVVYFHSANPGFLASLKNVINEHVQNVKIKQTIHPFLQSVHWAAKKLKTRIESGLRTEKRKRKPVGVKSGEATFEMLCNKNHESDLITSFIDQTRIPLEADIKGVYRFLYNDFLCSSDTLTFLLNSLRGSLENFTIKLVNAFMNSNWSVLQDIPSDVIELVEMLCKTRVQQFCANTAPTYLLHVVGKNRNPFGTAEKKRWSNASAEEKKSLCNEFLHVLLQRTEFFLVKEIRDQLYKKSHFHLIKQLKEVVTELLAVRSFDDACRTESLKLWRTNLQVVIEFCTSSIREINPHPSLDVQADMSLPEQMVNAHEDERITSESSQEKIVNEMKELLLKPGTKGADVIYKLETKLRLKHGDLKLPQSQSEDQLLWAKALVTVLGDKDPFNIQHESSLVNGQRGKVETLLSIARERLFAHQKSSVSFKILKEQSLPENEVHVRTNTQEKCLEVLVSAKTSDRLDAIRKECNDPSQHLAPIFIPTIRPGPTPDIRGNYFLEDDPWSRSSIVEEEGEGIDEVTVQNSQNSGLNIFLVVEPQHLRTLQTTVDRLRHPKTSDVNLTYVVLPQNGRGIGVTRAVIKILAECFDFSLYWTVDDDIQFMYQFDGNDRRWRKCSLTRGLLFGQRVFQTCRKKAVKELSVEERDELLDAVISDWPSFAKKTTRAARRLLIDGKSFAEVLKNPSILHSPFTNIPDDCGGDAQKEEQLKVCERDFVDKVKVGLFKDTINHIAGVSIAHESTKKSDFMSKYPTADYMQCEQRSQVVLNNADALKGRNFVTDEMIFNEEEFQIHDEAKRDAPHWGIRGSEKSFCRALSVSGVISYRVIRVIFSQKKLSNIFDSVGTSHFPSISNHRSGDEDDELTMLT